MRFAHTNIAATNWKDLSDFYINVFECIVKPPARKLSGQWLDNGTGLSNAELEGVHLLLPGHGNNGPTLEIYTYKIMTAAAPVLANHAGFTHIAFEVDDVDVILKKALTHGAKPLGTVTVKEVEGVGLLKFVYFRDPEDNIIEIQSWS